MSEEATTPDLVELMRAQFAADNDQDVEAVMSFYAADAVWDLGDIGFGVFAGAAAIRGLIEDWWATWEEHETEVEQVRDLGHGVAYAAIRERCRMVDSDRQVEQRRGWVVTWAGAKIERVAVYLDLDDARGAAERLAASRA
jgi:ketosteroid isomerase-like protein